MPERPKWKLVGPPPKWFADDAEVLAEMDTGMLVGELRRRGFQPDAQTGGWSTVFVRESD